MGFKIGYWYKIKDKMRGDFLGYLPNDWLKCSIIPYNVFVLDSFMVNKNDSEYFYESKYHPDLKKKLRRILE